MHHFDDPPQDDEHVLVTRIAAGDRCAFERLYERRRVPLFAYCRLLTPDQGLAEELTQDTLIAVWRGANRYAGQASVWAWMLGIARRQANNSLRRRYPSLANGEDLEMLPAPDPGPEEITLDHLRCAEIAQAIATLSPNHREILHLTFDQELSYDELAEALGKPIGTVKSRLSLARRALRSVLLGVEAPR